VSEQPSAVVPTREMCDDRLYFCIWRLEELLRDGLARTPVLLLAPLSVKVGSLVSRPGHQWASVVGMAL